MKHLILVFICGLLLMGFDKSEEIRVISVVESMITAINEKDTEGYIKTLRDYFIKVNYGDKEFIRQNMKNFGHVDLLDIKVTAIKTYLAFVNYKLIHTDNGNSKTTFYGAIILERTSNGWKVYSVSEQLIARQRVLNNKSTLARGTTGWESNFVV